MATVKLWTDAEAGAQPRVKAIFDDIRATRKSDFINNFWRGLANQPDILERTWNTLKAVMGAPTARSPDPGADLHRRFDHQRLLLLHPFAYGGGPREGNDRRAIL
jgi:alkylhydroperoxidase family enzyme